MRSPELDALRLQVLPLFHTTEDAKSIASRIRVSPKSLRKWWSEEFGQKAVAARGKAALIRCNESRGAVFGAPKRCPKCGAVTDNFRPSSRDPNRPRSWCSICEAENTKLWHENLTPRELAERLVYQRNYNTLYYAEHSEELRAYARKYRLDHPEQKEKLRQYFIEHPEKMLLHNAKQRSKRFNVPFNITDEDILACIPADGRCPITLQPFERGVGRLGPQSMTLDRVIPSLGYVPGNIAVISHLANTMKSDCIDHMIFLRVADYVEGSLKITLGSASAVFRLPGWMIKTARKRAKDKGLLFTLTALDIEAVVPSDAACPITLKPFVIGLGKVGPASPSLDRIKPEFGYVPGNVTVISHLANTIKQGCTDPEVFHRLAAYLEGTLLKACA